MELADIDLKNTAWWDILKTIDKFPWKKFYKKNKVYYEEEYKNGKKEGNRILLIDSGKYEGEFAKIKFVELEVFILKMKGYIMVNG